MSAVTPDRPSATAAGASGEQPVRCFWCQQSTLLIDYHDHEWGRPVTDDCRLFEKICLDGFQSGLSWLTILRKRDSFRRAFAGFDPRPVAAFGEPEVQRLLLDNTIVRHRGKILAAINNARRALALQEQFGSLSAYFWRFEVDVAGRPQVPTPEHLQTLSQCPESVALARDLRQKGWTFVGPTTVYAFMQAMGLVNDHQHDCRVGQALRVACGGAAAVRGALSEES
ncbi:DNA-3-methyladenine glycosylase I [Accumulibacter sp.]|uniref:DNA-3-methyladenine glycosylase I n=1 Tax=Accumulibacter sp. TaxID=2053492 RepID=UPI0025EC35E7|nr:DNA-3-methyladenine glycosylase I [Accumulibacter sp.]MCM8613441.1 DNA-3-methyladenine glycosylase I [Accumulibacter sp.]MCM8637126.1 DNA-3-methyladenine glycosylase I [Accumulibacter sp.]MCM8640829.1 DNA-3-methyladenine glycosylase I [Accumulibacter sp.]